MTAILLAIALTHIGATPVVVELFTSQGCSSCPPADALVHEIAGDESLRGKVIPLAFHVDYWNRLGWSDPFSSAEWSRRQMFYVRTLRLQTAYTPQAIVNGAMQFVGSNRTALTSAVDAASRRAPIGTVRVEATRSGNNMTATVHATAPEPYNIVLSIVQNDVTTNIGAGENSGRTQTEDAIVRKLQRVTADIPVTVALDPSWRNLTVVAFLQNRETMQIGNAAVAGIDK